LADYSDRSERFADTVRRPITQEIAMEKPYHIAGSVCVLPSYVPIPGLGLLPVNAFVLKSTAPVLIDTGLHADADEFLEALRAAVDPHDLRWIWLTHVDQDHVGSLRRLLDAAPRAKVVTSFLGLGKLSLVAPIPPERLYLLNPGQGLDVGDRTLVAVTPPAYDAPETTGLYDAKSGSFFSSDCFGGLLDAPADNAEAIAPERLREGQALWTTIDVPWLRTTAESWFTNAADAVRRMAPKAILSSHLPPAFGMTEHFLGTLACARTAAPFVGPDQASFEAMLARAAA
jgi:glyoxylase-like metal-dependent hydrolase (beta-lactamase superfamily II)